MLNFARGVGADDAKSSVEGRQLSDCTGLSRAVVLMGTLTAVGSFCGNSIRKKYTRYIELCSAMYTIKHL